MADVTKVIQIIVQDGEVEQLTQNLEKAGHKVEEVESKSKRAGNEVDSTFDKASESASNLQGGLEGVAQEAVNVGKAAKEGGQALRTALSATIVGALVVALGLIVENWETIKALVVGTNDQLQRQQEYLENQITALDHQIDLLETQKQIAEVRGESVEEYNDLLEEQIILQQAATIELANNLRLQLEAEESQIRQVTLWEKIQIGIAKVAGSTKAFTDQITQATTGTEEQRQRLQELTEEIQNQELKFEQLQLRLEQIRNPETRPTEEVEQREEPLGEIEEFDPEETRVATAQATADQLAEIEESLTARLAGEASKRQLIAELEAANRQELLAQTANALRAFSDLAGKETGVGKALAIASTLISTYQAAQQAYASQFLPIPTPSSPIRGAVAAGAAIASGLANVKEIIKVKTPNDSSQGAGSAATPQAPAFNLVGNSPVNQIAETLAQPQEPIQAFVVAQEVTSQQELDQNILDTATIGS